MINSAHLFKSKSSNNLPQVKSQKTSLPRITPKAKFNVKSKYKQMYEPKKKVVMKEESRLASIDEIWKLPDYKRLAL